MTMAAPREHALSKKLRRLAAHYTHQGETPKATAALIAARYLDQTIAALGIWKDPERIKQTSAHRAAERELADYDRNHPGHRIF